MHDVFISGCKLKCDMAKILSRRKNIPKYVLLEVREVFRLKFWPPWLYCLLFLSSQSKLERKCFSSSTTFEKCLMMLEIICSFCGIFLNKPCSDCCNNMPLRSVFFYINWTDRSPYGWLIPYWWSIIPINHIKLNIDISR